MNTGINEYACNFKSLWNYKNEDNQQIANAFLEFSKHETFEIPKDAVFHNVPRLFDSTLNVNVTPPISREYINVYYNIKPLDDNFQYYTNSIVMNAYKLYAMHYILRPLSMDDCIKYIVRLTWVNLFKSNSTISSPKDISKLLLSLRSTIDWSFLCWFMTECPKVKFTIINKNNFADVRVYNTPTSATSKDKLTCLLYYNYGDIEIIS